MASTKEACMVAESDVPDEHEMPSGRTTAPMSEYTNRDVAIGTAVLVVGLVVAFAIPLVLV